MGRASKTMRWRSILTCFLLAVLSSACIALPLRISKPFTKKKVKWITVGVTTRNEIIDEMGSPHHSLVWNGGSLLAYDRPGFNKWFVAAGGGYSGTAGTVRGDSRYLLRIYVDEEDVVTSTSTVRVGTDEFINSKDCLATDLCFDNGTWLFLASPDVKLTAIYSAVPPDLCSIFVFSNAKLWVGIDDEPRDALLTEEIFAHHFVPPGNHRVRRYLSEFEFDCEAGQPYYLQVWADGKMQLVSADSGVDAIARRSLVLTAQEPEDSG